MMLQEQLYEKLGSKEGKYLLCVCLQETNEVLRRFCNSHKIDIKEVLKNGEELKNFLKGKGTFTIELVSHQGKTSITTTNLKIENNLEELYKKIINLV